MYSIIFFQAFHHRLGTTDKILIFLRSSYKVVMQHDYWKQILHTSYSIGEILQFVFYFWSAPNISSWHVLQCLLTSDFFRKIPWIPSLCNGAPVTNSVFQSTDRWRQIIYLIWIWGITTVSAKSTPDWKASSFLESLFLATGNTVAAFTWMVSNVGTIFEMYWVDERGLYGFCWK